MRAGHQGTCGGGAVGNALKKPFFAMLSPYLYEPEIWLLFAADLAIPAAFGASWARFLPVWLGFKGGGGAATYMGLLLALTSPVAMHLCLVARRRRPPLLPLAALVAGAATPFALWLL